MTTFEDEIVRPLRNKSLLMPGRGLEEFFMNSKNFS
jgi:hypothetical protein